MEQMLKFVSNRDFIQEKMTDCEKLRHFQQGVYSIYKDVFTVVCFDCGVVRTTYNPPEEDE